MSAYWGCEMGVRFEGQLKIVLLAELLKLRRRVCKIRTPGDCQRNVVLGRLVLDPLAQSTRLTCSAASRGYVWAKLE